MKKNSNRHTKIICTLGPVSDNIPMMKKMAERGMNVARINFSHGPQKHHKGVIDRLREMNEKFGFDVKILQDLTGYRIRIGNMKKKRILEKNNIFYMSNEEEQGDDHIPFDYPEDIKTIEIGMNIFIDDGYLQLKAVGHSGKKLKVKVVQGGVLNERKGVNIPLLKLQSNIFTEKDQSDLQFAIENKFDKIAMSFVRNRKDIQRVVDIVRPHLPDCKIIAKIENEEGVKHVDSIIDGCDGVMVARGDLGVTVPFYKLPIIQKYIIRQCARKKKLAITATQMMDSMIEEGRPTRAEVSDVANAILDGTDYVMLSGETAVGKYPSRSIQVMSQIIEFTEKSLEIKL